MEIDLDHDLSPIARGVRALQTQSYLLGPVGYRVRTRIRESERRLFAESPWAPRRPSTITRYRYPLASGADEQDHLSGGSGPLQRLGLARRTLTQASAPGRRDTIRQAAGGLDVTFAADGRGPVSYINFQPRGSGRRRRRDPFRFDREAHADAATDVVDHIMARFGEGS